MKRNYIHKKTYVDCDCGSFSHAIRFSYFPDDKDDPDNNVIYLTALADSWRNNIWPFFWDKEWKYFKEHFTKGHWKDYYRYSLLKRISMALEYICNGYTKDIVYGGTGIIEDDFDKIYDICSWLTAVEQVPKKPISITADLSDETFYLTFGVQKFDGRIDTLETEIYFTKASFYKRVVRGIKYIFGRYNNMELCFSIDKSCASFIKGLIRQMQHKIKEFDESYK
jgi:hypothetical protein